MLDYDTLAGPVPLTRHEQLSTSTANAVTLVSAPQTTLEVTTLDDTIDASDGFLSLREAISVANDAPGEDTIIFADSIRGGTIELAGTLPTITGDLVIDGDPLDRGAGGIVIDGGVDYGPTGSFQGYQPFGVTGAAARFEDLTVRNSLETGIGATSADIALERAAVARTDLYFGSAYAVRGDGSLVIVDSEISQTSSREAVAYAVRFDGDVTIERSTIRDSSSEFAGGVSVTGNVRIVDSAFVDNTFIEYGETLDVIGSLTIENSSFVGNGSRFGGTSGLVTIDGDFVIVNSTFAGNAPGRDFGGEPAATILIGSDSTGSIVNSTLTGSLEELSSGSYGYGPVTGLYLAPSSRVTMANSIIDDGVVGTIASNGANTFRDAAVDGTTASDRLGVVAEELFALTRELGTSGVNAGVADYNGGPTPTVALGNKLGNPALDRADPADTPAFDQRGMPRDGLPDIGAFERGTTTLPPLADGVAVPDSSVNGVPRSALVLSAGADAAISFVDETATSQSSLGVYLIGPNGAIVEPRWVFERIEHALRNDSVNDAARPGGGPLSPGETVLLSDLYDPWELQEGVEFGLFLVTDGAGRNPFVVFDGGNLEFRTLDFPEVGRLAEISDATPPLVHIAEDGVERLIQGDILHTIDADATSPLSNSLNPGGTGQVVSGLLDGAFTVAFEDKPLGPGSDRGFNDALFAVEPLITAEEIVAV